jgi:hypothetical protein
MSGVVAYRADSLWRCRPVHPRTTGNLERCAGVAQWQSPSLPSWSCGFDSRRPLQGQCAFSAEPSAPVIHSATTVQLSHDPFSARGRRLDPISRLVGQEPLKPLHQRPELPFNVLGGAENPHRLFSVKSVGRPWWRHYDSAPQGQFRQPVHRLSTPIGCINSGRLEAIVAVNSPTSPMPVNIRPVPTTLAPPIIAYAHT